MIALWALLLALPNDGSAVVRTVTPGVRVLLNGRPIPMTRGSVLPAGAVLDSGTSGYAELDVLGLGRARLSAGSRVALPEPDRGLQLLSGRLWVVAESGRPGEARVEAGGVQVWLGAGQSVVLELRSAGELTIVPRGSRIRVEDQEGQSVLVAAGRSLAGRNGLLGRVLLGGAGLADLVAIEARAHEGDRIGLEPFLLEAGARFEIGQAVQAGVRKQIHGGVEVSGYENGTAGALVEEGIRPPPFFEEEVPPKGPNVAVEVGFRED